jgi:hypothetical protein
MTIEDLKRWVRRGATRIELERPNDKQDAVAFKTGAYLEVVTGDARKDYEIYDVAQKLYDEAGVTKPLPPVKEEPPVDDVPIDDVKGLN